jgi:hypothetical protein
MGNQPRLGEDVRALKVVPRRWDIACLQRLGMQTVFLGQRRRNDLSSHVMFLAIQRFPAAYAPCSNYKVK